MLDLDAEAGAFIDRVGIDLSQPFTREQLADLLAGFAAKMIALRSENEDARGENKLRTDR